MEFFTKFFEKIREKGLTIWPDSSIMNKRQDGRSMSVREAQTAMKPEIAAKAGNFGGVSPTIGRQRKWRSYRPASQSFWTERFHVVRQ